MINIIKNLYRHFTTPTTAKALGGVDAALKNLRAAADQHTRREAAALRLMESFAVAAAHETTERERATRVADRLEDLIS